MPISQVSRRNRNLSIYFKRKKAGVCVCGCGRKPKTRKAWARKCSEKLKKQKKSRGIYWKKKTITMEPELKNFTNNVDAWIKQIRREFSNFSDLPRIVGENTDNMQHNYDLIYELKDEIDELKQEVNALKLIQFLSLKKEKEINPEINKSSKFLKQLKK